MAGQTSSAWHLTRLLMILCWGLWILVFFVTVTLFQAVLQIHVVAQVVRQNSMFFEDLTQLTPVNTGIRIRVDDMLVRYYLEMRYSLIPDVEEMQRRWGPGGIVDYMSSPAAYRAFMPKVSEIERLAGSGFPRVVDVLNIKRHDDYYSADFDLYSYDRLGRWNKTSKTAILQFGYVRGRATLHREMGNPNGFVILRVSETEKKSVTN